MNQASVTVVSPLALTRVAEAQDAIDALGNPAHADVAAALDRLDGEAGTHFASLHAIRSQDGARGYLVLEFSADGEEALAVERITAAIGDRLRPLFMLADDWASDAQLKDYLLRNRVKLGAGWFSHPGVAFAGTPGMTVGRIRTEAALAADIPSVLGPPGGTSGLARLQAVRAALASRAGGASRLDPAPSLPTQQPSGLLGSIGSFLATFLWPIAWVLLLVALLAGVLGTHGTFLGFVWAALWRATLAAGALLVAAAGLAYLSLRRAEAQDALEERAPPRATQSAMFARENHGAQNHMASITQRKPGALRAVTSRLVFWAVGAAVARLDQPGFLSGIGTIHFARWVTLPNSPDVLFLSNYDGSWESYLEDFITRAHTGLTAIWSNSIGFPRTSNLTQDGATDGERFKRYARHSMQPTRFWYSAYPHLTTTQIRTNAQIRLGLSGAMTEDEAVEWLALFGSAERPAEKLLSSEIQSLVFGGLNFMPFGTCLVLALPPNRAAARSWLAGLHPDLAFDDGRHLAGEAVATLALGATGLAALGLPTESLETFPFAFLEGMTTPSRSRILGDNGDSAPSQWRWGGVPPDAVLLVYGRTPAAAAAKRDELVARAEALGLAVVATIPLKEVDRSKPEPFGFADGISQPLIRGTYKSLRNADPIHLVEPGEFILGYPDNRHNMPPGPTLAATFDPDNALPLLDAPHDFGRTVVEAPRQVGFNGSYLVIRELEQDVDAFHAYCAAEATRLAGRLRAPYEVTPEFVGAKLVGRWQDGASLARHPYAPPKDERHPQKEQARPTTAPIAAQPIERAPKSPRFHSDNDFLFGTEDPEALRCPFGAHIRRSNPRDSFDPGSKEQVDITNRHRILRVGRQYAPEEGQKPGLLFMCLNGDIERQFEFVQQSWLKSPSFHGLSCEKDPLLADGEHGASGFTIPTREGPVRLSPVPAFVRTRGGGYFSMPGKRLVEFLSKP